MNPSNNPAAGIRRAPWRLWLAGISAGTLLAAMLAPPTGWIARGQVLMQLGFARASVEESLGDLGVSGHSSLQSGEERDRILRVHPNDFQVQLAGAMEAGREARERTVPPAIASAGDEIRKLTPRFGSQPGLYAAALRMDTSGVVRIVRPETAALAGDEIQPVKGARALDPARIETFDRDAATGERLEPDNAFFPTMRAVGCFAAHRDDEAISALLRAADGRKWDEHLADELDGKWRLVHLRMGDTTAIHTIAVAAAILFPHYSQIRAVSQLATLHAMELEKAGHPEEGARIRRAVMRVGDLMRSESTSIIGNLVGIAVAQIGVERPGGATAIKLRQTPSLSIPDRDVILKKRLDMLSDYWNRNGLAADVPTARARYETGVRLRDQVRHLVERSLFNESSVARLVVLWSAGTLLLANVWWLLVAGGIGSVLLSRRRHAGRERMPRSGPWVLAAAAAVFAVLCLNMFSHQWRFVSGLTWVLSALSGSEGSGPRAQEPLPGMLALVLGAALPALLALGSVIVSVARRVPLRVGLARGFSRVGVPLACLLVLAFCGLCVETARWEVRVNDAVRQTARHEGRYLAGLAGQEWPGPIE